MQFSLTFAVILSAEAAVLKKAEHSSFLNALEQRLWHQSKPHDGAVHFGDTRCPCIGFDNIEGSTMVELEVEGDEKMSVSYPADLGARCEAWDQAKHPSCSGDGKKPGWCKQRWCLVDPCRCNIEILPKPSVYLPMATYVGKPLFFSYATCGGKDMWTNPDLVPEVGKPKCRCIGFNGMPGSTEVQFSDNKLGVYPGDVGGSCKAWDNAHHPSCKGEDAPAWCQENWCYVDPCSCELPDGAVPKISAYLPEATFTGKNLYYSYETCHSEDKWTKKHNKQACVNQETEGKCDQNPRCAWTGKRCLGAELVSHPLCVDDEKKPEAKKVDEKSGAATGVMGGTCLALAAASLLSQQ